MSERKVLNKYYPIDYDPRRLPRQKDHGQQKLLVLPVVHSKGITVGF